MENFFDVFNDLTVLVIGDVMLDQYLVGSADRISPEAPVPVVNIQEDVTRLGGSANVGLNLKALGAQVVIASVVGEDGDGVRMKNLLKQADISTRAIVKSESRKTTIKTRVLSGSQQLLRYDREDTHDLSAKEETELIKRVISVLDSQRIDVMLFQDYNKGVLTEKIIRSLIKESIKRDIPSLVDPKEKNFFEFRRVTLFKPNLREVRESLGWAVEPTLESLTLAAEELERKLSQEYTLITLGADGMFFKGKGIAPFIQPAIKRTIADVCGAGDTVISVAAMGLAGHLNLKETVQLANLAGSQVCERVGVVPVELEQLKREYGNVAFWTT